LFQKNFEEETMDFQECVNSGVALFEEGKIGPAIEKLEEALKLQPANAQVRQMLEMLKGQADELLSLNAAKAQASANEAKQRAEYMGITDVDKAISEYTDALRRNPNDAEARSDLASAYYIRGLTFSSKGEQARAIEDYNETIKNQPDYFIAFDKRGWANLEVGNYDQAVNDFEKLVQFHPNDDQAKQNLAGAYNARAIAYDQKGDYAHAIPDFEMVLTLTPDDATTRELLAMAKAEAAKK
jgi:tetratricopeptide (TPR) repeat protein